MSRRIKWACVPLLAVALAMSTDTSTAKADGIDIQVGRFGFSSHNHRGHHGHRYSGYRGYVPTYRYSSYRYPSYRGGYYDYHSRRPHLDWHGPSLVPHGNHYDYVPGHWDVHYGRHHHH